MSHQMISRTTRTRRVLVTGAGGFIGRPLVRALTDRGIAVVAMGRRIPQAVEALSECVVRGDLADPRAVEAAMTALSSGNEKSRSQDVIHLAGIGSVEAARADSHTSFEANVIGTHRLLEACRSTRIGRFVLASSGLVYGNRGRQPVTEDAAPAPASIYAATKLAAEVLAEGYAADSGFACDIARLSNVYGAESPESTVAGMVIRQAREGRPIQVRSLSQVRDFIYVDDVVKGFLALLQTGGESGCRVVNLSSGVGTSIADLVKAALQASGLPSDGVPSVDQCDEAIVLANGRMAATTGWRPAYSLLEGLRSSISLQEVP